MYQLKKLCFNSTNTIMEIQQCCTKRHNTN